MKPNLFKSVCVTLALAVGLAGCAPQATTEPSPVPAEPTAQATQVPAAATAQPSPAVSPAAQMVADYLEAYRANLSGAVSQPVADANYASDARLTPHLVSEAQALEAGMRGMPPEMLYDLFLLSTQVPQRISARTLESGQDYELVLVDETFSDGTSQTVTALTVENGSGWQIDDLQLGNPGTAEGAAQLFLNEYVQDLNAHPQGEGGFDLASMLSPEYQRQVAEIRAGFEGGGFDPVLGAQMTPPGLGLAEAVEAQGSATRVDLRFGSWTRSLWVENRDGRWQIVPEPESAGELTAAESAEAFYTDYLAALAGGTQADALASPAISSMLRAKLDNGPTAQDAAEALLCGSEIPAEIHAVAGFDNQSRPVVVLTSDLPNHTIVVDLIREDFNRWALRQVTCGDTAAGAAKAFYAWYLGYATGGDEPRNPLSDGAYRDVAWLSDAFKSELDSAVAAEEGLAADPILFAQDLPARFSVIAGEADSEALVNLQFGDATVQQIRVAVQTQDGAPRIHHLSLAAVPESAAPQTPVAGVDAWAPYTDGAYGFGLRYPAAWRVLGLNVADLHTPEEYSAMRSVTFAPPEGVEGRAVQLDVQVGEVNPVGGLYTGEAAGEMQVNGVTGQILRQENGALYVVFQHPNRPKVWLAFSLNLPDLPGLDPLPAGTTDLLDAMVSTLVFSD